MKRYLSIERISLGQVYDGMGLELWACGSNGETLFPLAPERDAETLRPQVPFDTASRQFKDGTPMGEGSDWGGKVSLTRLDPLLSARSVTIYSDDLHRSTSSRNHPNPSTSTTTVQFDLPRASSSGIAVYEDTAILASAFRKGSRAD